MKKEQLAFKRIATEKKDGKNGFLYFHHFGTGWQELIFDSHEAAKEYATKGKMDYHR